MSSFSLTDKEKQRLQEKFREFQQARDTIMIFLVSYIADYQKFHGSQSNHKRFLHQKYSWRTPRINYLFNSGDGFYWSVRNIAIVLGRSRSSITRTINKMKASEKWNVRLLSLRKNIRSESGLDIDIYHQEIFDLLMDYYEEEYLLRFSEPRHGNIENAPDINELRRFWEYLKSMASIQKSTFVPENLKVTLPFGWRYRFRKIARKVLDFIMTQKIFSR